MKIDWDIPATQWGELVADGKAWEILVPEFLPLSLNDLVRNSWNTYAAERRWIQHYLSSHYRDIPPALDKRAVEMCVVKKGGQLDDEPNLDGRSKGTMDAMKRLGWIRDDNKKWLEWHHVQQVRGAMSGLVIRLWEVDD